MKTTDDVGQYIKGYAAAHNIAQKALSGKTGIHQSTLSRKLNGVEPLSTVEAFSVGVAVGKLILPEHTKRA